MGARGTDEITKNLPNVWAWVSGTGRQFRFALASASLEVNRSYFRTVLFVASILA